MTRDDILLMDIREQLAVYAKAIMDKDREIEQLRQALQYYREGEKGYQFAEREACARLCEEHKALRLAEMIRERGEKP